MIIIRIKETRFLKILQKGKFTEKVPFSFLKEEIINIFDLNSTLNFLKNILRHKAA